MGLYELSVAAEESPVRIVRRYHLGIGPVGKCLGLPLDRASAAKCVVERVQGAEQALGLLVGQAVDEPSSSFANMRRQILAASPAASYVCPVQSGLHAWRQRGVTEFILVDEVIGAAFQEFRGHL